MKLSSRSTNDLKEFVLNEPKMSPSTRLDGVPNLATIGKRQEMPVHVETTAVSINQGKGTSNQFVRNLLPRPLHLRLSNDSLFDKIITTLLQAVGLKAADDVYSLFTAVGFNYFRQVSSGAGLIIK